MSWVGTFFSWFRDEKRSVTVFEHFGHDLRFGTPWGVVKVPGKYKTDLFTGVDDTDDPEFQGASVLHDWCCDELRDNGVVLDEDGNPIMTTQEQVDLAFLFEMLSAIKRIMVRMLHDRVPVSKITATIADRVARALVYHRGVRWWDRIARKIGARP